MHSYPEDLLSGEEFVEKKYRRRLFPKWIKVLTIILMLVAALALFVFVANIASGNAGEMIRNLKNGWEPRLGLLTVLDMMLLLPAGWALLRENRGAVRFSLIVTGILIPPVCFGLGQEIYSGFNGGVLFEEVLFLLALLGILVLYFVKLFRNRKEWELRISTMTGK